MGVKNRNINQIKLSEISNHFYLRLDAKYYSFQKSLKFNKVDYLKNIFDFINGTYVDTEHYSEIKTYTPFIRIGDLRYKGEIDTKSIIYINEDFEIDKDERLRKDDIILATIGATIGKINKVNMLEGGLTSNNTIILRIKNEIKDNYNINFLINLLQTDFYNKYFLRIASHKSQPNLQFYDLKNIQLPQIKKSIQDETYEILKPLLFDIETLHKQIESDSFIINRVFAEEFKWDMERFEELKQVRIMNNRFALFGNNVDIRFSNKFHNKAGEYVTKVLRGQTSKRIKDYLEVPIVLGASISPSDFDESGEYYYVSMALVKNWKLELDETQTVSDKYAKENLNKSIKKNDIIMTRSGVAIGKFALIDDDEINGIFADFTMRIRLKDYNNQFAYYYFRTNYFQHLIFSHKKGLQNQNIFPIQIREFPIPDISIKEQNRIAEKIKAEIDAQREIDRQIEEKQKEISGIIEEAIRN